MTPSLNSLVERVRAIDSHGSFVAFICAERERLPGSSHPHQGIHTGMRVQAFQNWLLDQNRSWKLTDAQLLAIMRLEFPQASGQVFTGDLEAGLKIVEGIRRHYNRDGHNGPSPQSRGLPRSISHGQF